jgi:hypothetical protein
MRTEGREQYQTSNILPKNNRDNNASFIQQKNVKYPKQKQNKHKTNSKVNAENTYLKTFELTCEKEELHKNQDNIEEVVESLINEENINIFLARQRLRFVNGSLNNQEMNNLLYLDLHIAAHNIDGIASVLSIQKFHNLLEFIKENNIDIMAILETNIDYRQEHFIN